LFIFVFIFLFTSVSYAFDPVAEAEMILNNAIARDAVRALLVKEGFDAVAEANAIIQRALAREIVNQGLKSAVMNPVFNSATGVFSYVLPCAGATAIATFLIYDVVQRLKSFQTGEIFNEPVREYDGSTVYISFVPEYFSLSNPFITSITYWTWDGEEVTANDPWDYCNPVVDFLKVDPRNTRSAGTYDVYIDGTLSRTIPNVYEISFQFIKSSDGYVDWLNIDFYYKDDTGQIRNIYFSPSSRARIDIVPHVTVLPESVPVPNSDVTVAYKVDSDTDTIVLVESEPTSEPTPGPSPDPSPGPTPEPSPLPAPPLPAVDTSPDLSQEVPPDEQIPSDRINFNPLKKAVELLTYKFPFSLPFDVWRGIKSLQVDPELMSFTVSLPFLGSTYTAIVNLADYPVLLSIVPFVRFGLFMAFVFGMIYATYELFGGAR
jgi:hypothetical protein